MYQFPANQLQLFLAKTTNGEWLSDEHPAVYNLENGMMDATIQAMINVGQLTTGTIEEVLAANGMISPTSSQIHFLVKIPDHMKPSAVELGGLEVEPTGPEVEPGSTMKLFAFLEGEMKDRDAILSNQRILDEENYQFRMVGREKAINVTVQCFERIIDSAKRGISDRYKNPIFIWAGFSGLGKTRMLEEGGMILRDVMKLDHQHAFSVIVPCYDEFSLHPVEKSMPIAASFSWRMLYRFFLHNNCSYSFDQWMMSRLPANGAQLTFSGAVEVIELKLSGVAKDAAPLYLFLGIDFGEKQVVEEVRTRWNGVGTSALHELVRVIAGFVCSQSLAPSTKPKQRLVVLPMLAWTDWSAIQPIAYSSLCLQRLPFAFLTMDQIYHIVGSNTSYAGLLEYSSICRKLFTLGGVPRWVVEYLKLVKEVRGEAKSLSSDTIERCFNTIWEKYVVPSYLGLLDHK